MSRNKPFNGGGIVGARPEFTGGLSRFPDKVEKQFDVQESLSRMAEASLNAHRSMRVMGYVQQNDRMPVSPVKGLSEMLRNHIIFGVDLYRDHTRSEPTRVSAAQIHAELYAETDLALLEPEPMTLSETTPSERVSTLLAMGFTGQSDVMAYQRENSAYIHQKGVHDQHQERYSLAMHYAMRYPAYKFISDVSLEKVLDKYGLHCRVTKDFIGTIPDANVQEMANFHRQVTIHPDDTDEPAIEGYFIAAPADQFKADYYGFATRAEYQKWLIDDPIVLKRVKGGCLIVTAWGDEAKDPDVVNERNN